MSSQTTDEVGLLIDERNETEQASFNNQSRLLTGQTSSATSSPYLISSTRRRVPPKRMVEEGETLFLNLSNVSTNNKRLKHTLKQEPLDEIEQSPNNRLNDDDNPNIKPRHSYCTLIILSLLSTPGYTMTLSDIYQYIGRRFAYYRNTNGNWQNGIRHNLSMNKLFQKLPRADGHSGKGLLWTFAKHVNPNVQFSQHLQQQNMQRANQSSQKTTLVESHGDLGIKNACSANQSNSHPLQTLILEQLQNAANGVYSNVNPLFGTSNGSSMSAMNSKTHNEKENNNNGLPPMTHEQLAMAQSNWYIAQLATQRGFAIVPEFYERCLKQIRTYYGQEVKSFASNSSSSCNPFEMRQGLRFNNSLEDLELARGEKSEEDD